MKYTDKITYVTQTLSTGESYKLDYYNRLKIEPQHPSYYDSTLNFDKTKYKFPYLPLHIGNYKFTQDFINDYNVNVLRLLIRLNDRNKPINLPMELLPLKDYINEQINYHYNYFTKKRDCYIYLTVRCTDDEVFYQTAQQWHVDGFQGDRIENHIIDQEIIWSNTNPTEFSMTPMFCDGLNPSKHNIHDFFDGKVNSYFTGVDDGIYLLTPYNVHRANLNTGGKRVFIRLTFIDIMIEDHTNTINPMLPFKYGDRKDVRNFLRDYTVDETIDCGFVFQH